MGAHDYYDSMERVTNKSDTLTIYDKYYLIKKNANKWINGEISSERLSEIVYGITNTNKIE